MQALIQVFFVVAVFISGFNCNLCGPQKDSLKIPEVDRIFRPPPTYTIHPDNLNHVFNLYKTSVLGVKSTLKTLIRDETASKIYYSLIDNLIRFDLWLEDIATSEKSTQSYVHKVSSFHKKYMKDNNKVIKTYNYDQLSQLEKNIRGDEKLATEQLNNLEKLGNQVRNALTQFKIQVDQVAVRFGNGDTSAATLKDISDNTSSLLSIESPKLKEISVGIKNLQVIRNEMRLVDKKLKYH